MSTPMGLMMVVVLLGMPPAAWAQAPADVKGEWMLSIHGDHVMTSGLRLEQDGTKVTGILFLQGKEAAAEGEYADRTLTLTIAAAISADHSQRAAATRIQIKAAMKDDGTLEGEMTSGRGPIKVTAERFKKQ